MYDSPDVLIRRIIIAIRLFLPFQVPTEPKDSISKGKEPSSLFSFGLASIAINIKITALVALVQCIPASSLPWTLPYLCIVTTPILP